MSKSWIEKLEIRIKKFKDYCYDQSLDMVLDAYFDDIDDPDLTEEIKRRCLQVAQSAFVVQEEKIENLKEKNKRLLVLIASIDATLNKKNHRPNYSKLNDITFMLDQYNKIIKLEKSKEQGKGNDSKNNNK